MGFLDIFNSIEIKGNKSSIILKWIAGVGGAAVVGAFTIGQLKMKHLDKIDDLMVMAIEAKSERVAIRGDIKTNFETLNAKIDNIYSAGLEGFEEYRIFNNQQLELIIEFGQSNEKANNDLLTRMLQMNSKEKAQQIENQIELKRREMPKPIIGVKPMNEKVELPTEMIITNVETNISTYYIDGAPENHLDTLNLNNYMITEKKRSEKYEGLFDFTYIDKEE